MGSYPPYGRGAQNILDLTRAQGRIQAEGALRSGDIWGSALSNLGQQLGGIIQGEAERSQAKKQAGEMAKRDGAWLSYVESGEWTKDPTKAYTTARKIWGPVEGPKQFEALAAVGRLSGDKRNPEQDRKDLGMIIGAVDKVQGPARAHLWPQLRSLGARVFPDAQIPEEYTDDGWAAISPLGAQLRGEKPPEPKVVGRDDRLVQDGKVIVDAMAPEPPKPPNLQHVETAEGIRAFNPVDGTLGPVVGKGKPPAASGGGRGGLSPTQESHVINRLTTQWDKAIAPAVELERQLGLMRTGLQQAKAGDLNAGQQAVLVTFQKILDPTSVVRESEYARSAAGQALLARIQGAYDRYTKGGAGFTMAEMEQFARLGEEFVKNASSGYVSAVKERTRKQSEHFGIKPELIFADYEFGGGQKAAPTAPSAAPAPGRGAARGGGMPIVRSPEEARKLPSGTVFRTPDGRVKTVP